MDQIFFFIFVNAVWLISGFITGITSFGGNLIAIPLLTLVMPPREVILVCCFATITIPFTLIIIYRKYLLVFEFCLLSITTLAGIPIGIFFLDHASPKLLLLAAALSIFLFLIWQYAHSRLQSQPKSISRYWALVAGLLSGILSAATGMGGPPLAAYAFLRKWGKENTLSTLNAAWAIGMLEFLPVQIAKNSYNSQMLTISIWGIVFGTVGIILSVFVIKHIRVDIFRRLLLIMLALSATMLFARSI